MGSGPDALLLPLAEAVTGRFKVYAEDGVTLIYESDELTVKPGEAWKLSEN